MPKIDVNGVPDGRYGPFHFNSMLVVSNGKCFVEPVGYEGLGLKLVVTPNGDTVDASLESFPEKA